MKIALSEHLKKFSAVKIRIENAVKVLDEFFQRFGPVHSQRFASLQAGLQFLIPLKSFTNRLLLLQLREWTFILANAKGENCAVNAYAISRATLCKGIAVSMCRESRELHLFERGERIREVYSVIDGDSWHFSSCGNLQDFEDPAEYAKRRKQDRLTVLAVQKYFEAFSGMQVPKWNKVQFDQINGIERSCKDLQVSVLIYETINDLTES